MEELSYETLARAVTGTAAAFRAITRLEPAGGPSDKVFPPTFGDEMFIPEALDGRSVPRRKTKYALEWRRIDGESKLCVVLDSVASQANRLEEALLEAWNAERVRFPLIRVRFADLTHEDPALDLSGLGGDGYLTALETPHRIADALIRDSALQGTPFRVSKAGQRYTEANPHSATALLELCPTALIFGVWDSTGPKGGLGAKFQRALVSEISGVGVELGVKTASRIDPAAIGRGTKIFQARDADEAWTLDPGAAKQEKKKPALYGGSGSDAGRPSQINHGNVTPSCDPVAGGVTLDYAEQVTVLSLPALRRLRFPTGEGGQRFSREEQVRAEEAARTLLAALALSAVAEQRANGYDLRSRCAFRPLGPLALEQLSADGSEAKTYRLERASAARMVKQSAEAAARAGLPWSEQAIDLEPAEKLVALIRDSRKRAAASTEEE